MYSQFTGPVSEDNFFEWEAMIAGPEGTPYGGGRVCTINNLQAFLVQYYFFLKITQ